VPRSKKSANPFYVLLVIAGVSFAVTAMAYGVMAFRAARPREANSQSAATSVTTADEHPLMKWMSRHGEVTLLTELALLAVCTFAAIGTDDYWQRRSRNSVR
jgi:hypothetical protein